MTLRNVGIVFSPTLGIPAGVFSELVSQCVWSNVLAAFRRLTASVFFLILPAHSFQSVFDDVEEPPATTSAGSSSSLEPPTDEQMDKRSKRNSMTYLSSTGPEQMLGLQGRKLCKRLLMSSGLSRTDGLDPSSQLRLIRKRAAARTFTTIQTTPIRLMSAVKTTMGIL